MDLFKHYIDELLDIFYCNSQELINESTVRLQLVLETIHF